MNSARTLSIITITYNDPKGFARTVESLRPLLGDRFGRAWELIVIDASPAVNESVLALLTEERWPLLHVESSPIGIFGSQNLGWNRSRGEYAWFLNGGDVLKDVATLLKMLDTLDRDSELGLLCAGFDRARNDVYLYGESPRHCFLFNILGANQICHQAILYRRRILETVGEFHVNYRLASDYEHLFRCYIAKAKVGFIQTRLVVFDMDGMSNNHHPVYQELKAIQRDLSKQLPRSVVIGNRMMWTYYYLRVCTLKAFAGSPAGRYLRPLWYGSKRLVATFNSKTNPGRASL